MSLPQRGVQLNLSLVFLQAWSATEKDVKESTIFEELPRILKRFWPMITIMCSIMVGIALLSAAPFVPFEYRVTDPIVQIPLLAVCVPHVLFIFVLNRECSSTCPTETRRRAPG